ncbi:hypothetical protein GCM10027184_14330 [Saccharothrix stipae]
MATPEPERLDETEPVEDDAGGLQVRNEVSAAVSGGVVQAGVVHGDLHFHPAPAPVVPRQLPAASDLFAGRVAELAELDRTLDPASISEESSGAGTTVVISAIGGAGGIGKTWLALTWANRHVQRFPDGQLFADLRGFSPVGGPMAPEVAVRGFLDALGVDPGRIPIELDDQAALYRSLVADKRMLIVLDNAATVEQVTPLLPGTGSCTVVVTSRNRLAVLITRHGARPLRLDTLTDAEAHALLVRRLGADRVAAEGQAVDELVRLCGGFPLALGLVAGRAHSRPHIPLSEFAAELSEAGLDALDDTEAAAGLPAVLSWSLRSLNAEHRTVFGLLGIAPGPDIGLTAAASLAGLSVPRASRALRVLEEVSLLDRQAHGRYSMHDLIRGYAAATADRDLTEGVREAALRRVLDFYVHTAHTGDRLLLPHRQPVQLAVPMPGTHSHPLSDDPAAMAWFDVEHANLLAAQRIAAGYRLHEVVWQLAWTLATFHDRRGNLHDQLAVWRAAVDASAHLPDLTTRTRAHLHLGRVYADLGRHEEATEYLHLALALADYHHDPTQQAHAHQSLAWAWDRRGDYRRALDHAGRALNLYRDLDQQGWEAEALNQVGWYAARVGEYDTARAHCQAPSPCISATTTSPARPWRWAIWATSPITPVSMVTPLVTISDRLPSYERQETSTTRLWLWIGSARHTPPSGSMTRLGWNGAKRCGCTGNKAATKTPSAFKDSLMHSTTPTYPNKAAISLVRRRPDRAPAGRELRASVDVRPTSGNGGSALDGREAQPQPPRSCTANAPWTACSPWPAATPVPPGTPRSTWRTW